MAYLMILQSIWWFALSFVKVSSGWPSKNRSWMCTVRFQSIAVPSRDIFAAAKSGKITQWDSTFSKTSKAAIIGQPRREACMRNLPAFDVSHRLCAWSAGPSWVWHLTYICVGIQIIETTSCSTHLIEHTGWPISREKSCTLELRSDHIGHIYNTRRFHQRSRTVITGNSVGMHDAR